MRTLYDVGLDCAGYVDSPDDPEVIGYAMSGALECIDTLNLRSWNFMLVTSGFPLVADQTAYNFASGIKSPRHCSICGAGRRETIGYLDPKSFWLERGSEVSGQPCTYTITNSNTMTFDRGPDSSALLNFPSGEIVYYARIPYPATSGDTFSVPVEVERVILDYARAITAERYDSQKSAVPMSRFETGFRQLRVAQSLEESTDWTESY